MVKADNTPALPAWQRKAKAASSGYQDWSQFNRSHQSRVDPKAIKMVKSPSGSGSDVSSTSTTVEPISIAGSNEQLGQRQDRVLAGQSDSTASTSSSTGTSLIYEAPVHAQVPMQHTPSRLSLSRSSDTAPSPPSSLSANLSRDSELQARRTPRRSMSAWSRFLTPPSASVSPASPTSLDTAGEIAAIRKARRRSSGQLLGNSPSLSPSPFASLIGSYENSLLSGRMSTLPSKPLPFLAEIGVIGHGSKVPKSLRCPPHLNLEFGASYYDTGSGVGTPYVGTVDLEHHYTQQLAESANNAVFLDDEETSGEVDRQRFPGYRIPTQGQIQIIIKNANNTAVKVFLVPYDLSDMPAGSKTFIRQKSYTVANEQPQDSPRTSDPLRYAVHLQFASPPLERSRQRSESIEDLEGDVQPPVRKAARIYLHKHIRIVFASRALDDSIEKLRTVYDGPASATINKTDGSSPSLKYSTYSGPCDEWQTLRRAVRERRPSIAELSVRDSPLISNPYVADDATSDPNGVRAAEALVPPPSFTDLLNTPPSPQTATSTMLDLSPNRASRKSPLSFSYSPSAAASPRTEAGLTFERRPTSPTPLSPRGIAAESALTISRPGSRSGPNALR
ncbi:uncharacterized protein L969DRAFT_91792 [Mixia osmundae IAM 14324]|uniref:Atos-like conserved domain-containing protein n=1 Tax=Mixia osmundae (strain CBS 9802 / IAM 14324 / JCM 22182 / KY 12970) TaxID=764103 RepID=G7EAJ1_MIXOS|nr:uncharacterized protein L969DRAFT_91792 [Mixia osmundae IAM 14324]KEI42341.1 hypothetical protein L969DRAFT_91792 [Mixia osmundae IAM 14324]GAA99851.1 hypothetical protein E5Q_06554 [Mixia osmundae IAM 14324]